LEFVEVLRQILLHGMTGCSACSDDWAKICQFVLASTTPGEEKNGDGS